jgi:hypothetical protein
MHRVLSPDLPLQESGHFLFPAFFSHSQKSILWRSAASDEALPEFYRLG